MPIDATKIFVLKPVSIRTMISEPLYRIYRCNSIIYTGHSTKSKNNIFSKMLLSLYQFFHIKATAISLYRI